jgi:hypothetical protein
MSRRTTNHILKLLNLEIVFESLHKKPIYLEEIGRKRTNLCPASCAISYFNRRFNIFIDPPHKKAKPYICFWVGGWTVRRESYIENVLRYPKLMRVLIQNDISIPYALKYSFVCNLIEHFMATHPFGISI